jgi:hypothetical protein
MQQYHDGSSHQRIEAAGLLLKHNYHRRHMLLHNLNHNLQLALLLLLSGLDCVRNDYIIFLPIAASQIRTLTEVKDIVLQVLFHSHNNPQSWRKDSTGDYGIHTIRLTMTNA